MDRYSAVFMMKTRFNFRVTSQLFSLLELGVPPSQSKKGIFVTSILFPFPSSTVGAIYLLIGSAKLNGIDTHAYLGCVPAALIRLAVAERFHAFVQRISFSSKLPIVCSCIHSIE